MQKSLTFQQEDVRKILKHLLRIRNLALQCNYDVYNTENADFESHFNWIDESVHAICKYFEPYARCETSGECLCNDCKIDVEASGNWYMATQELWKEKLGLGWNDNLCIPCLEKRLGRRVEMDKDIEPVCFSVVDDTRPISTLLLNIIHNTRD